MVDEGRMAGLQFSPFYSSPPGEKSPPGDQSKRKNLGRSGMTFVELIMVLAIMGILSAVLLPKFDFLTLPRASAAGAAYMIASDIRYAQEFAMANALSKSVTFSSGSNIYSFTPSHNLDPSGRLPSGMTIGNNFTVTFNSLGEPIAGGGGTVIVSGSGQTTTIQVIANTGKVNIL